MGCPVSRKGWNSNVWSWKSPSVWEVRLEADLGDLLFLNHNAACRALPEERVRMPAHLWDCQGVCLHGTEGYLKTDMTL